MKTFKLPRRARVARALIAVVALAGFAATAYGAGSDAAGLYSPTPIASQMSGDLAFYGGWLGLTTSPSSGNTNGSLFGGLGRVNIWLNPTTSAQFDLSAANDAESKYDNSYAIANLAAHLSHRSMPGRLVGVFGSLGYFGGPWGDRLATIGLEGQAYAGPILLYGQAGYSTSFFATGGTGLNALYVHGEARYFFNPNLMLAANLGYARANETGNEVEPHDLWRWGADLEWKHDSSPFGAFLSYQGSYDVEHGPSGDSPVTDNILLAGLKFHFGNQTLKAESDSGATLKDFNPYTSTNHVRFFDWN